MQDRAVVNCANPLMQSRWLNPKPKFDLILEFNNQDQTCRFTTKEKREFVFIEYTSGNVVMEKGHDMYYT